MKKQDKKTWKIILITINLIAIALWSWLYYSTWDVIVVSMATFPFADWFAFISIARIIIIIAMASYLYNRWFKQDEIYLFDAFFLFASFFLFLGHGKVFDFIYAVIYGTSTFSFGFTLFLVKLRYFLVILMALTILFIGADASLIFYELRRDKELSKKGRIRAKRWIISLYLVSTSLFIVLAPTSETLSAILPYMMIFIYLICAIMFFFMYKNNRLSKVHSLIVGIGFLIFVASNLIRSILTARAYAEISALPLFWAQVFDIISNIVIFLGFLVKPPFAKK
ncbi:MAG: hypothetical protein ACFE9R_02835 [Candidatus Hermodarchaeota archaeon]